MTMRITDFDTAQLDFEHVMIKKQQCILPRMTTGQLLPSLETPWIELTNYGIPKANDYFRTDKDRMFIQLPIQTETELHNVLTNIDTLMQTEEMQNKLFQDNKGYTYKTIIKQSKNDNYPASMKVKLMSDQDNNVCTEIYEGSKQLKVQTIDEACKAIPYKSEVKLLLKISKVWVLNKTYGITIKAHKIRFKQAIQEKPKHEFLDD